MSTDVFDVVAGTYYPKQMAKRAAEPVVLPAEQAEPTPGPWWYDGWTVYSGKDIDDDTGEHICSPSEPGSGRATEEANGRLIAAAPDMLAALEALLGKTDGVNRCFVCGGDLDVNQLCLRDTCETKACRAAIAKARGSES